MLTIDTENPKLRERLSFCPSHLSAGANSSLKKEEERGLEGYLSMARRKAIDTHPQVMRTQDVNPSTQPFFEPLALFRLKRSERVWLGRGRIELN